MPTPARLARVPLAALFVLALAPASSGQDWVRQSALPTEQSIDSVQFPTLQHGFLCGTDRVLMESLDGGETWTQADEIDRDPMFFEDPYYRLFFLDEDHGWVFGNNNDCWRTTDSGASWQRMTTFPAGSYDHVDFVDTLQGWVGGNGSVVRTRDGGLSWEILTWWDEHGVIWGMDFWDADHGAFVNFPVQSWPQGIWTTQDGGDTWTLVRDGSFGEIRYLDGLTLLAVSGHTVERSDDGGQTWQTFSTFLGEGVSRMEVIDPDTVAAVDWQGSVFLSDDRGATWVQTLEGLGDLPEPWDIRFTDPSHGFISGPGGWLLSTDDGGFTWTQMNQGLGAGTWADLQMHDESFGLAVGSRGYVTRTTDGGHTWSTQKLEVTGTVFGRDEDLNSVCIVDAQTAFAAGNGGVVYRSLDAGLTWQSIGYPALPEAWINYVGFADADHGWAVGQAGDLNAFLWRTEDGGQTWTEQDFGLGALYGGWIVDADTLWVVGSGDVAWKTTDGGANWVPYPLPALYSTPFTDIQFDDADPDHGWALAYLTIIHTDNGGITWDFQDLPGLASFETPLDVSVVDADRAWISTGSEGHVFHTTDAGATWTEVDTGADDPFLGLDAIWAVDDTRVWTAGFAGVILASDPPSDAMELVLDPPFLQRGMPADLGVHEAAALETVYYAYSLSGEGQSPPIPQLGGLTLDILTPIVQLGSASADAAGDAVLTVQVPANAPLVHVSLQAAAIRGTGGSESVKSNPQTATIQP